MTVKQGFGAYKKTSIQTSSKEQILLMLYQAAIKNGSPINGKSCEMVSIPVKLISNFGRICRIKRLPRIP